MKTEEYTALLQNRLGTYFDFLPDGIYENRKYTIAAVFSSRENQSVLSKSNVMDYLDSTEILLVTTGCTPETIRKELERLPDIVLRAARPSRHHKSTVLTRVFISSSDITTSTNTDKAPVSVISPETVQLITSFRFSKVFRFCFWGWAEVRTVYADLSTGTVFTNKAARFQKKSFIPGSSPDIHNKSRKKTLQNFFPRYLYRRFK